MSEERHETRQRGNVIVGIIIGVVLGLAAALAVAVYVTKVPVPFLNKGQSRTAEQDAAEIAQEPELGPERAAVRQEPGQAAAAGARRGRATGRRAARPRRPPPGRQDAARPRRPDAPAVAGRPPPADPLGDLAAARTAAPAADPFLYFVQAGAFRTPEDAEAQRAKLSLMGIEAKVTEREQSGRQVFRVRVGPFDKKDDADRQQGKARRRRLRNRAGAGAALSPAAAGGGTFRPRAALRP